MTRPSRLAVGDAVRYVPSGTGHSATRDVARTLFDATCPLSGPDRRGRGVA